MNNYNNPYDNNMGYNDYQNMNYNNGYPNNYNNGYTDNYNMGYNNNAYNDNYNNGYNNNMNNYNNGYNNNYNMDYNNNPNNSGYVDTSYNTNNMGNSNFNNNNNNNDDIDTTGKSSSIKTKHRKTIGPDEFDKKMKKNIRPFNFMLIIIYVGDFTGCKVSVLYYDKNRAFILYRCCQGAFSVRGRKYDDIPD